MSLLDGLAPGSKSYSPGVHFAQMISLLGPPPQALLGRADKDTLSGYFNEDGMLKSRPILGQLTIVGEFKRPDLIPTKGFTFEDRTNFLGGKNQRLFIDFASKMLRWLPGERWTARQLIDHPWLKYESENDEKSQS